MKRILIILMTVLVLSGCKNETIKLLLYKSDLPNNIQNIVGVDNLLCSVIYHNRKIWIIENNCGNPEREGIYMVTESKVAKYGWYDKQFNKWAINEGCNTKEDCFYNVTLNSKNEVIKLNYEFYINLSEGFYKLKVHDGQLNVVEKSVTDHPS